ncbi:MAG: type IV secretory system conjugative DNA transfer family protein, partial [Solirubrobacteraceae bacterium]
FRVWMVFWLVLWYLEWQSVVGAVVMLGGAWIAWVAVQRAVARPVNPSSTARIDERAEPLSAVQSRVRGSGGGVYLGETKDEEWRVARPESAVLVLGPPRSGKTSGVIIPALLSHPGPAVSTSTKPDVLRATLHARSRLGRIWQFDPTDTAHRTVGEPLRWSPVSSCGVWDDALLMARAMVQGSQVGLGTTDSSHWQKRAQALLAALLHAAVAGERDIAQVLDWVVRHELDEPGMLLERRRGAPQAISLLVGLENTEGRERSSIFSAAADALDAYASYGALDTARDPNFWPSRFVRSSDTIYIHAPAEQQAQVAPLVCGLLAEIRRETYHAHAQRPLSARVLFALDEVRNIAPLGELPQMASEGGGQGLCLLSVLQDLSQARERWGQAADGFLTLFQSKLILPGIADRDTLESVSVSLGEYDRQVISTTQPQSPLSRFTSRSRADSTTTISTQRQRVLSPGEIANIPWGYALYLDGVNWELLRLGQAHRDEPWRTLTQLARPQ